MPAAVMVFKGSYRVIRELLGSFFGGLTLTAVNHYHNACKNSFMVRPINQERVSLLEVKCFRSSVVHVWQSVRKFRALGPFRPQAMFGSAALQLKHQLTGEWILVESFPRTIQLPSTPSLVTAVQQRILLIPYVTKSTIEFLLQPGQGKSKRMKRKGESPSWRANFGNYELMASKHVSEDGIVWPLGKLRSFVIKQQRHVTA